MAKDGWDKLEILGGMAGGILIPLAIFVAGQAVANAERNNARLDAQAGQLTSLIEHLSSTNTKQQLIAIEIAGYFAERNQLPSELVPTITRIAKHAETSETARAASEVALTAATNNPASEKFVRRELLTNIRPRVYFHIPKEEFRAGIKAKASLLESSLKDIGLVVPGVELKAGPANTELRYFKADEKAEAEKIRNQLAQIGIDAKLVDLSSKYENSKQIRPKHYELWLGKVG